MSYYHMSYMHTPYLQPTCTAYSLQLLFILLLMLTLILMLMLTFIISLIPFILLPTILIIVFFNVVIVVVVIWTVLPALLGARLVVDTEEIIRVIPAVMALSSRLEAVAIAFCEVHRRIKAAAAA